MPTPRPQFDKLLNGDDLTEQDAGELMRWLAAGEGHPALAGGLLAALRAKGVTALEVRGFASAMRSLARQPRLAPGLDAIDLVGTGGDASGSLNLSTGAALLTAACGMPVIKHGNRSMSSRCGSADLIEALGLKLPLDEEAAARCFEANHFTFLFAPYYHPAMKAIAPIRTALAVRTVFNLLGPLTNPAAPRYHLIGAYDVAAAELIAATLSGMPLERAWVVHGAAGWDEATPIGPFVAFEVTPGQVQRREIDPLTFGLARCQAADLAGADAGRNAAALRAVFARDDRGAHRGALALQAGLALHIAGRAGTAAEGVAMALETIDSGRAQQWLSSLTQWGSA